MNKTATVYAIRHMASGDAYVGCSKRLNARWLEHRRALKAGTHHSARLQALWNRDGEGAFAFVELEHVDGTVAAAEVVGAEVRWISKLGTLNTHIADATGSGFSLRPEDAEQRRFTSLAVIAADPALRDFLTTQGKALAQHAKSPKARAAKTIHAKRRWADPTEAAKLRSGLERHWADPDARKKAADRISNSTDELRRKRADGLKATWADPEKNKALVDSRKKRWADPEAKARQAKKMKAIWAARRAAKPE